jgi:hypothetical protein
VRDRGVGEGVGGEEVEGEELGERESDFQGGRRRVHL